MKGLQMANQQAGDEHLLDEALRASDPIGRQKAENPAMEAAFDAMTSIIVSEPRRTSRRFRLAQRPRTTLVGVAACALMSAGVAVAATNAFVSTHTNQQPPKAMVAGGGPGELLNVNGTDFSQVAQQISSDVPYPAAYEAWRQTVASSEHSQQQRACPPGSLAGCAPKMPSGALHEAFAASAFAGWVLNWRHDMLTGQKASAATDAQMISGAASWPAVTAWDPHPSTSVPGDMGTTSLSVFGWTIPFATAIAAGDLAAVDQAIVNDATLGGQFAWWVNVGMGLDLRLGLVGHPLLTYLNNHPS